MTRCFLRDASTAPPAETYFIVSTGHVGDDDLDFRNGTRGADLKKRQPLTTRSIKMAKSKPLLRNQSARELTLQETATALGVSVKTIRRKIKAGELPVLSLGRLLRVSEDDLRIFKMQRRTVGI